MNLVFTPTYQPDGSISPASFTQSNELAKKIFAFENVEVYTQDEAVRYGAFGHPIFMPFKFEQKKYKAKDDLGQEKQYVVPELFVPICIIDISRSKNIEMTTMEGGNGTVKEFGSHGDYQLSLKMILVGDDGKYPEQPLKHIYAFDQVPESIDVSCDLLQWLGIYGVVINSIKYPPSQGFENIQAVEIEAVSDMPVVLKIKNKL